ncbi:hypothetical protein HWV62_15459 [Athelia sp. TMB]|nr:hypothetical protein HWV62_15459 [Athelia sp. TMB]
MSSGYVNKLTPPAGTYFKRERVVIVDIQDSEEEPTILWRADVYVYPTGAALTDPDGWKDSGYLQVVIVHSGHYVPMSSSGPGPTSFTTTLVGPYLQLPPKNTGVKHDDYITYTVDFSQSMSMYQQQDAINFDASFQQSFTSKGGEYLETVSSSNTMFGFNNVSAQSDFEFVTLSAFTFPKGQYQDFSIDFKLQSTKEHQKNVPIVLPKVSHASR